MSILTNYKKNKSVHLKTEDPKIKTSKTRGYMSGVKMTPVQMEAEIIRLSKTNKIFEIVNITGKNRRTIERYLKKAKDAGKILTSTCGNVTLPEDELAKRQYQKITRDELYAKYQPVREWVDSRRAEAKGDKQKLQSIQNQLGNLKVVCDSTKLNPHMLLSAGNNGKSYGGLEHVMKSFSIAMTEQRVIYQNKQPQPDPENIDGAFRVFLMATRSFATYNGVAIPKMPRENILSGKKVGFGKYAHIKMSIDEIDKCVTLLKNTHGENAIEVAMFIFYYVTGCRNNSIYNVKTSTCQREKNGWITCKVYESKTKASWKKYIPDDNPHFEILEKYIELRKNQHKLYLFSEHGSQSQTFKNEIITSFKKIYEKIGFSESYFLAHAIHCLRHVATHYWLDRTELNHSVVAKIVGWKDIQTLITCYGEITDDQIFSIATNGALT